MIESEWCFKGKIDYNFIKDWGKTGRFLVTVSKGLFKRVIHDKGQTNNFPHEDFDNFASELDLFMKNDTMKRWSKPSSTAK